MVQGMSQNVSRGRFANIWIVASVMIAACSAILGVDVSVNNSLWWLVASVVPLAVMLITWRAAAPAAV